MNPHTPHLPNYFQSPFIVMDTQCTTWEGAHTRNWSGENEWREIVQIAAVKIDPTQGFKEVGVFETLIKPTINPVLSNCFVELTGITQEQVDAKGVTFEKALGAFSEFAEGLTVWSYGFDDKALLENCLLYDLPYSPIKPFYDLRMVAKLLGDNPQSYSSGTLYKAAGITMEGHVHNALHDCRSIVQYLKHHFWQDGQK